MKKPTQVKIETASFSQYNVAGISYINNPKRMSTVSLSTNKMKTWVLLLATFLITNFLFFIDEGYFDFTWMSLWGNWVMFVIYFLFIFTGQWLMTRLSWRFEPGPLSYIFGITLGSVLGGGLLIVLLSA